MDSRIFVVAAASPLTGVVGAMPLNFMLGNGAGVPGSFIVAALLLIIFSFGFIAMSKYIVNAGAFYTYIVQGLGVGPGISGLSIAILAYTAIQLAVTAMFGFLLNTWLFLIWTLIFLGGFMLWLCKLWS
ncbi:hypothetical protein MKS77_10240 [Acinetobacter baumannii]